MADDIQNIQIKKDILVRLIKTFFSDDFEKNINKIPIEMRPKYFDVPYRCCIHKERAIIRDRIIANLGFAIENDDEIKPLADYARDCLNREEVQSGQFLTVIEDACRGCTPSKIYVTDLCKGCVKRPCEKTCRFGAISIQNGKSQIDASKCRGCKMCISACPYNAIVKLAVPCEDVCPVGAIQKNEKGFAEIDFDECISCGRCASNCPFGAISEKSQIIHVLKNIKSQTKVIAMFAPAIVGQFDCSVNQLMKGILDCGFDDVYEVAKGADITTRNEAREFIERMNNGASFMTTSCCAGYNELVKKHLSDLKPYVSNTKTPLYYTAKLARAKYPDAKLVFISPCLAKRAEVYENPDIDFLINPQELEALFIAKNIDLKTIEPFDIIDAPSKQGRNYPLSGGVYGAVEHLVKDEREIKPYIVNGLNKDSIRELKKFAKNGSCPNSNLIEVMACPNGCIGGNSTIENASCAKKRINDLVQESGNL